ncbi:MAG: TraR/DksA C4-type zinc finger protein [Methylotenera sp.]|nr:TraR/DksA C4-type zinc finger protein [Methylotenera sp.]
MLPTDQAQILEESERDSGINTVRARVKNAGNLPSAKFCVNPSCGEVIPEARRIAYPGVRLCTECKAFNEQYGRLP